MAGQFVQSAKSSTNAAESASKTTGTVTPLMLDRQSFSVRRALRFHDEEQDATPARELPRNWTKTGVPGIPTGCIYRDD
jgi:hypothetical protein